MAARKIHLVGTFPPDVTASGAEAAFAWVAEHAEGADLVGLPCDLDDRWIIRYLDRLADRPQLRAIRTGDSEGYDRVPIYRPVRGRTGGLRDALVNTAAIEHAGDLARAYRAAGSATGAPLQLSRPSPLDLALFTFCGRPMWSRPLRTARGSYLALRRLPTFHAAFAEENRQIGEKTDNPLWQLETPARPLRPEPDAAAGARSAGPAARPPGRRRAGAAARRRRAGDPPLLRRSAEQGDRRARRHVADRALNALGDRLTSRGRGLPRVHVPFCWGTDQPPVRPAYYAPLSSCVTRGRSARALSASATRMRPRVRCTWWRRRSGARLTPSASWCGLGRHDVGPAEAAMAVSVAVARA